ncbi:hypothetical protein AOCH_002648 [Aspergillus ochraceoroseus]|uniref:Aminoglycoside phosphotransferase domain-containing protein n=1 Tax=Aspergillus ochraceoroseus TaxID=138278 RepID=A0A0F8UZK9_9EURO|nr:hypothetical protein AOCH_002648 [Aspergillus ochraceoroseus]
MTEQVHPAEFLSFKRNVRQYAAYLLSSPVKISDAPSMKEQARPIVTREEIQKARDLCPHRISGCKILEISESIVLKMGPVVFNGRSRGHVPVPEVINAYMIEDVGFIVMQKISGILLAKCWNDLPDDSQQAIMKQLSCLYGPCDDIVFKHPWGKQSAQYGSSHTRKEYNQGVVAALRNPRPHGQLVGETDYCLAEEILASGDNGNDERKVFTHGDLHPTNIIVEDGQIADIIDWGASGYSVASSWLGLGEV